MQIPRHGLRLALRLMLPLAMLAATGCHSVRWQYDYGSGGKSAANRRCRTVIYFSTAGNPDCREMDWKTWNDRQVRELMREFVPVRQDLFINARTAAKLGVTEVPTVVVVRPDGSIAGTQTGKLTPEALRVFLIKHRFN